MKKGIFFVVCLSVMVSFALTPSIAQMMKFSEAPVLADMVKAGKIPPVAERLPEEPMVVNVVESIGKYGGELQLVRTNPSLSLEVLFFNSEPPIVYDHESKSIIPNWAKSWEFSQGGRVLTLKMRKGMKWSDGAPVTSEDVRFAIEDVWKNKDIKPNFPSSYAAGGEAPQFEVVDDYTFRFRYSQPFQALGISLASATRGNSMLYPSHHLKKFHLKYGNKAEIDKLVADGGFDSWGQMFLDKNWAGKINAHSDFTIGFPVISMLMVTEVPNANIIVMERNPYFWKVDAEGNQLPYIDRVVDSFVADREAKNLKIVGGEVDFLALGAFAEDATLYFENEERGDYKVKPWPTAFTTRVPFIPVQTYPQDPVLQELHRNRLYRIALSLAIDRDEINEIVFGGAAMPASDTSVFTEPMYKEQWAHAYSEYDPEISNILLDHIGLTKRDSAGFRLRSDGKRLEYNVPVVTGGADDEEAEIISRQWEEIGIKMNYRAVGEELWGASYDANELEIAVGTGTAGSIAELLSLGRPPVAMEACCKLYVKWFDSEGKEGQEPPDDIKNLWKKWKSMPTLGPEEWVEIATEIFEYQAKHIYSIGTVSRTIRPLVVSNRLKNVPIGLWSGGTINAHKQAFPEQFFIDE